MKNTQKSNKEIKKWIIVNKSLAGDAKVTTSAQYLRDLCSPQSKIGKY